MHVTQNMHLLTNERHTVNEVLTLISGLKIVYELL